MCAVPEEQYCWPPAPFEVSQKELCVIYCNKQSAHTLILFAVHVIAEQQSYTLGNSCCSKNYCYLEL